MEQVTLRRATREDLTILEYWDTQPHVIAATAEDDLAQWEWELEQDPQIWEVLIAAVSGTPIGVIRIIDSAREPTGYWGPSPQGCRALDIWIGEEGRLGQGFGTKMMRQAMAYCFETLAAAEIWIDPLAENTRAHRFYERLGFQFRERVTLDGDDCCIYTMTREDWARDRQKGKTQR